MTTDHLIRILRWFESFSTETVRSSNSRMSRSIFSSCVRRYSDSLRRFSSLMGVTFSFLYLSFSVTYFCSIYSLSSLGGSDSMAL
jgi:hypothetical protein